MDRVPLESEGTEQRGLDPAGGVLEVDFTGGRVYRYFDVSARQVERLLRADSRGAYFSRRVRDRYRFLQVQ